MEEKNNEVDEIKDEIDSALNDPRGLSVHQRRLAFCLSSGVIDILEKYLKKYGLLKQGVLIDHRWFKKSKENVKEILSEKTTGDIARLKLTDKILDVAYNIESKRNDLAYGKKVSETILKDLIDQYLEILREIEKDG